MRALVIVLDSVGIGALPDADRYGDAGSNTLGNIARHVPLATPTLRRLGLATLVDIGAPAPAPAGACGRMSEASAGKDSVTGHWEMTGIVLDRPFPTFPEGFPADIIAEVEHRIGRRTMGNVVGSGTVIIDQLGPAHLQTGAPIVYTSADSVFQIAAHESLIPIEELYRICLGAFEVVARGRGVARVIARPFIGEPGGFSRTANRRDFCLQPPEATLLDRLSAARHAVVGIGKIEDLFGGRGLTEARHTSSDDQGMDYVEQALGRVREGLIFANLVDFDTEYGHRNNVAGYAANLERFDARLNRLLGLTAPEDLLIVTADHGNDPTTPSTDHSREYVPVLAVGGPVATGRSLGTRTSFADLGQTLAALFGIDALPRGRSFLAEMLG
jgi:phosphopentomutase